MLVSSGMSSSRSSCVSGRWLFKFSRSSCVSGRWLFHFLFLPSCALSALWGCLGPSPWLFVIEVRASHRWLFMKLLISLSTIYIYILYGICQCSMSHVRLHPLHYLSSWEGGRLRWSRFAIVGQGSFDRERRAPGVGKRPLISNSPRRCCCCLCIVLC